MDNFSETPRRTIISNLHYRILSTTSKQMLKQDIKVEKKDEVKAPMGFEAMTSCLLDRRSNQLSYGALLGDTG